MPEKTVSPKTLEWVEKLNEAGAARVKKDRIEPHPVIRSLITSIHAALAGNTRNETFVDLERAFDAAMDEVNEAQAESQAEATTKDASKPVYYAP